MRGTRRHARGITLVEVLVSMAIFGIVMAIAYAAINGSLRIQADQEAVTSAQGRLRRVMEVLTQDLRSAVFGSITNQPYASGNHQVSFMMLTGGAGYTVLPPGSLHEFPIQTELLVQMVDASHLAGTEIVMVNTEDEQARGVILPVNRVFPGPESGTWRLMLACRNTIPYSLNSTLIFEIETVGMRYDAGEEAIMTTNSGGGEVPFAFGISDFRIEYVYTSPDADMRVETVPVTRSGVPVRSFEDGADTFTLERVQFAVAADASSRGRTREQAYTGQVDLSRTEYFRVEELVPCG